MQLDDVQETIGYCRLGASKSAWSIMLIRPLVQSLYIR